MGAKPSPGDCQWCGQTEREMESQGKFREVAIYLEEASQGRFEEAQQEEVDMDVGE